MFVDDNFIADIRKKCAQQHFIYNVHACLGKNMNILQRSRLAFTTNTRFPTTCPKNK